MIGRNDFFIELIGSVARRRPVTPLRRNRRHYWPRFYDERTGIGFPRRKEFLRRQDYGCPAGLVNALTALIPAALAASMTFTIWPKGASVSARMDRLTFGFCAAWVFSSSSNLSAVTGRCPR